MYLLRPLTLALSTVSASSFLSVSSVFASSASASASSSAGQCVISSLKMSATDFAKNEIDSNNVVIFSKSYCPHCTKTKELFGGLKVDGTVIHELDQMDNGADIQASLLDMTGQRTVPNVFIKGKHVGGNDACQAANASGKLKELLDA